MLATQKGRSNPVFICCKRSEKDKMFSFAAVALAGLRKLSGQALFHRCPTHARNSHYFISAGFTAGYGNGRSRNLKQISKEFNHCLAGFAFDRWSGQREFQRVAHGSADGILARARMDPDGKRHTARRFLYRNHCRRDSTNSTMSAVANTITCGLVLESWRKIHGTTATNTADSIRLTIMVRPATRRSAGRLMRARLNRAPKMMASAPQKNHTASMTSVL